MDMVQILRTKLLRFDLPLIIIRSEDGVKTDFRGQHRGGGSGTDTPL